MVSVIGGQPMQQNTTGGGCGPWCYPVISANGRYVAFAADASNLAPGATNPLEMYVYRKDRVGGGVELADVSLAGQPGSGRLPGYQGTVPRPSISGDGRYVAFASPDVNLVPGDTNLCTYGYGTTPGPCTDVFVHDFRTGTTVRVSVSSTGAQADGGSYSPAISANGRYVAFASQATNLAPGDTNGVADVFVHDLRTNKTVRISVSSSGAQGNGASEDLTPASVSAGGRYVTFGSTASNLAPGDLTDAEDIFVHDMTTGRTQLVSRDAPGSESTCTMARLPCSTAPVINPTGRFVAFTSYDSALVPNDTNSSPLGCGDVFLRDLRKARTTRVSVSSAGEQAGYGQLCGAGGVDSSSVYGAGVSADGRYVAFTSTAPNLYPGDPDVPSTDPTGPGGIQPFPYQARHTYVHDTRDGSTRLVDVTLAGTYPNEWGWSKQGQDGWAYGASLDASGRFIAFESSAGGLDSRDPRKPPATLPADGGPSDEIWQFYVRDQGRDLGVGGLAGNGSLTVAGAPSFAVTGVVSAVARETSVNQVLGTQGVRLTGATLAYRARRMDMFVRLELQKMPSFEFASPAVVYGFDLTANRTRYQLRAARTDPLEASFGLFRRDATGWTQVATLRGGYGTTGEEVVVALPLRDVGLQAGGQLSQLQAFSAAGSYLTGAADILDQIELSR